MLRTVAVSIQPNPGGYDELCFEINRGGCQSGRTECGDRQSTT